MRRQVGDTVIILEEGNLPHPRCEECDMLVPWRSLSGRHKDTEMCRSGAVKNRRRDTETEFRESTEREEKRNEGREEEESRASGSSGAEWSGVSADEWEGS